MEYGRMEYISDTTDFQVEGASAVTMGKFDGLHRGHMQLLRKIVSTAKMTADVPVRSVVFVLNSHPEKVLLTRQELKTLAEQAGIDVMINCPFVPEISAMMPEEFVQRILVERLHTIYAAVGTDFRFGHGRQGDAAFLMQCGNRVGFRTEIIRKESFQGREISSTYVREALAEGNMELVSELLGRDYALTGTVAHGAHLGTSLGFPTANILPPGEKLLPPDGVYYTETRVGERSYTGVTNIGFKPTVDGSFRGAETFLFAQPMDLYGKEISTRLRHFRRREIKFADIVQLQKQVTEDIASGRIYFDEQRFMVRKSCTSDSGTVSPDCGNDTGTV